MRCGLPSRPQCRIIRGCFDDRFGRGEVLLDEERGDGQHVGVGVEAIAGIIGGEVGGRSKGDSNEIADCVVVLGAIQPSERHATRIWRAGRDSVDPREERFRFGLFGPWAARRRHPP